jgi:hypothetical protein
MTVCERAFLLREIAWMRSTICALVLLVLGCSDAPIKIAPAQLGTSTKIDTAHPDCAYWSSGDEDRSTSKPNIRSEIGAVEFESLDRAFALICEQELEHLRLGPALLGAGIRKIEMRLESATFVRQVTGTPSSQAVVEVVVTLRATDRQSAVQWIETSSKKVWGVTYWDLPSSARGESEAFTRTFTIAVRTVVSAGLVSLDRFLHARRDGG